MLSPAEEYEHMMECLRQTVGREFGYTKKLTAADFSEEEYQDRRRKLTEKYRIINAAVAAGEATDHQLQLHTVKATTHRAWLTLQALRREFQKKDPVAYKELTDAEAEVKIFRTSKPCAKSVFYEQEKQARFDRILREKWIFEPMSDIVLFDLFLSLEIAVGQLLRLNIVYIGITTLDGNNGEWEFCRWALKTKEDEDPAIKNIDGSFLKSKADLDRIGCKFEVLAEHCFAYNMRRLGTFLQTTFRV
jgi:hypothetical protein